MLRGGVPLTDALELSGRATGSALVAAATAEQAEAVRHGRSLADAVRRVPGLAGMLSAWVEAGEVSGDLAGMLEVAAERARRVWERRLTRSVALVEPVLLVLLGLLVLVIALAVLLPVLALNRGIGMP